MIGIVTALQMEAAPLIERFELKRDLSITPFEVFLSSEFRLIVSGIGKLRSAMATTFLLTKFPEPATSAFFNIGFCGAKIEHPIGELYLANRVTDSATRRQYYSDMILRHKLHEATLETFDIAVTDQGFDDPDLDLVDMEGSGFFEAASAFLTPDQIYCLKIVSDHLECGALSKELVDSLIGKNLTKIEDFILDHASLSRSAPTLINDQQLEVLNRVGDQLRLTVSQKLELKRIAHRYLLQGGTKFNSLLAVENIPKCSSKGEGKREFERIKKTLN